MDSSSLDKQNSQQIECYSTASLLRAKKKAKTDTVSTICIAILNLRRGKTKASHMQELQVLLDSGCSGTMINKKFLKKHKIKTSSAQSWATKSGTFETAGKAKVVFTLPEFHEHKEIEWDVHVDQSDHDSSTYDMIMGRDLLDTLGMDLLFSEHMMKWDNATVPMRNPRIFHPDKKETFFNEMFLIHDPLTTEAERIQRITDIKYSPANFDTICEQSTVLNDPEKDQLKELLRKHHHLFDGTLGKWTGERYNIELKPDAEPYHAKPYPVPHSQETKLKAECEHFV